MSTDGSSVAHLTVHIHAYHKHLLGAQICSRCESERKEVAGGEENVKEQRCRDSRDVVKTARLGIGWPGFKARLHYLPDVGCSTGHQKPL